jgi:hypothetical protein
MKERAVRRRLHEQLQQLRGNIRVMCRSVDTLMKCLMAPFSGILRVIAPRFLFAC